MTIVASIMPFVFPQFEDENGEPYAGGSLTFSYTGTNDPLNVYSDSTLSTSIGNVVVLNAAGRPTSNGVTLTSIFMQAWTYRVKLKDADGATIVTADGIADTAFLGKLAAQPNIQVNSGTGTQNDLALTGVNYSPQILRMYNASNVFISGFSAGLVDGQRLSIFALGVGGVFLAHQSSGSLPANRLVNLYVVDDTILIAGSGEAEYVYDGTASRWRMVAHEMGGFADYTVSWTSASSAPVIGNGSLTGRYTLRGRLCLVNIVLSVGASTTFGTGNWFFSLPIQAEDTNAGQSGDAAIYDAGTGVWRLMPALSTTTKLVLWLGDGATAVGATGTSPITWVATDAMLLSFSYIVH